jgi:hypothetical protein
MNLRHAVALASLGWYLMLPPPLFHQRLAADTDAPLSKWTVSSAYDSANECNDGHLEYIAGVKQRTGVNPSNERDRAMLQQAVTSQCIASDDPRLNGK